MLLRDWLLQADYDLLSAGWRLLLAWGDLLSRSVYVTCCDPGYECGEEYGSCQEVVTSKTIKPTPKTKTKTTSKEEETETPELPDFPSSSSTTASPSSRPHFTSVIPTSSATPVCSILPQKRAVADIWSLKRVDVYVEDEYDTLYDIARSICLGMKARGVVGNHEVLTYAGSKDECYKQRRRDAKCKGCCTGITKNSGPWKGTETQCDEYPFAMAAEGGENAHKSCVTAWQNSLQGGLLSLLGSKLVRGEQFVVRVVGIDCADVQETDLQSCKGSTEKRQTEYDPRNPVVRRGFEDNVRIKPYSDSNVLVIPIGDLSTGGVYFTHLKLISGHVDRLSVVSNSGRELASVASTTGITEVFDGLAFELGNAEDESGVGVLAFTSEDAMNMTYDITVSASENTSSTAKSSSSSRTTDFVAITIMLCLALSVMLATWGGMT